MVKTAGSLEAKGQIKTIKMGGRVSGGRMSAGRLSAGKLTAGALEPKHLMNATRKLIHPNVMKELQGAGFFDKFTNILNTANKALSTVGGLKNVVNVGKTLYNAKSKIDKIQGGKMPVLRRKSEYNRMLNNEELSEDEGGKLTAGSLGKSKRKLPEALRKRAVALGKYMKQGHDMKTASEMYKKNGK